MEEYEKSGDGRYGYKVANSSGSTGLEIRFWIFEISYFGDCTNLKLRIEGIGTWLQRIVDSLEYLEFLKISNYS